LKATIQEHTGELEAAETACAEMKKDLEESTSVQRSSRKRLQDQDNEILNSLQKRVAESGSILKDIAKAQQQPLTARTVFANFVKDSLLTMSMPKYKKARSTINSLLSKSVDASGDDDTCGAGAAILPPQVPAAQQTIHNQPSIPLQQGSPSFGYGQCQQATFNSPHMWNRQSQYYELQCMQDQELQHQQQQLAATPVSDTLSIATQVLNDQAIQQSPNMLG